MCKRYESLSTEPAIDMQTTNILHKWSQANHKESISLWMSHTLSPKYTNIHPLSCFSNAAAPLRVLISPPLTNWTPQQGNFLAAGPYRRLLCLARGPLHHQAPKFGLTQPCKNQPHCLHTTAAYQCPVQSEHECDANQYKAEFLESQADMPLSNL